MLSDRIQMERIEVLFCINVHHSKNNNKIIKATETPPSSIFCVKLVEHTELQYIFHCFFFHHKSPGIKEIEI